MKSPRARGGCLFCLRLQARHPRRCTSVWIGEWHTHPDGPLEHATSIGVGKVVLVAPAGGARNGVVEDGPTGTALAESVRDIVRGALNANSSEVHLYLATPAGLALLLGNRWNRLRSTVLYEFVEGTYVRAIEVPA